MTALSRTVWARCRNASDDDPAAVNTSAIRGVEQTKQTTSASTIARSEPNQCRGQKNGRLIGLFVDGAGEFTCGVSSE